MALNYNGLAMTLVQTRRWEQVPIKVGQAYAGVRYTATVLANLNTNTFGLTARGGTEASPRFGPAGTPIAERGLVMWAAIRERLMAQRRPLLWLIDTVVIADVAGPTDGGFPDIELGPKPLACNVVQFNGGGSVLVEYTIQWAAPACPKPRRSMAGSPRGQAVLAHVWAVDEDIDPDWFITRTYRGRIHFDPTVVGPAGTLNPESLQGALFPAISPDMRRVKVDTIMSEDGYSYQYRLTDKQPHQLVNNAKVTRLVATHSVKQNVPTGKEVSAAIGNMAKTATSALRGIGNTLSDAASLTKLPDILGTITKAGFGAITGAVDAGVDTWNNIWAMTPIATHSFSATAYGHNGSDYVELARAARVVCLWRCMKLMSLTLSGDWGGDSQTENTSEPRSVTFSMNIHARPRYLYEWDLRGTAANVFRGTSAVLGGQDFWQRREIPGIWDSGNNTMPTNIPGLIPGAGMTINAPITTPTGMAVPTRIKQLMYGGTPGSIQGEWNGFAGDNASFAPELLGVRDAGRQPVFYNGTNAPGATPLSLALVAALQDPCSSVTNAVTFPPVAVPFTSPSQLPGA